MKDEDHDELQSIHDKTQAAFYKEKLGESWTTILTNIELQRAYKYAIVETKRGWTDHLCELGARPLNPKDDLPKFHNDLSVFFIWDFVGGTGWWRFPEEVAIKCLTLGYFPSFEKKIVTETV